MWWQVQLPPCLTDLTPEELRVIALHGLKHRIAEEIAKRRHEKAHTQCLILIVYRFRQTYGRKPTRADLQNKEFITRIGKDFRISFRTAYSLLREIVGRPPKYPPSKYPSWT
jgi:hypothetical protein